MELLKIETGNFMADGGALFGVVPKMMWENKYPCNNDNYCNLSMRCLLIRTEGKVILIDTGAGDKQSEKFFSYQHLNGGDSLEKSFKENNVSFKEVTDVILTHLHFDHCGGAVQRNKEGELSLTFPNATYWVGKEQWDNFNNPDINVREGSVYFEENIMSVLEAGKLEFVDENTWLTSKIEMRLFNGHTPGMIIPFVQFKSKTIVYMADFIPVMASIPEAWVAAYDTAPLTAMKEKRAFIKEAFENEYVLFFEHDLYNECCTLINSEKGIKNGNGFALKELIFSDCKK